MEIKNRLTEKLNLSCVSVGTGDTDMISLTCAQAVYPGGILHCQAGKDDEVLGPYSVTVIPGLDEKTKKRLKDNNIWTVGRFYAIPEKDLGILRKRAWEFYQATVSQN